MTGWIIGAVLGGIAAGYLFIPQALAEHCGTLITVGLCLILFLVGVDMGRQGNVWRDIKAAGFKVLLIPVATAAGTLGFAALGLEVVTIDGDGEGAHGVVVVNVDEAGDVAAVDGALYFFFKVGLEP